MRHQPLLKIHVLSPHELTRQLLQCPRYFQYLIRSEKTKHRCQRHATYLRPLKLFAWSLLPWFCVEWDWRRVRRKSLSLCARWVCIKIAEFVMLNHGYYSLHCWLSGSILESHSGLRALHTWFNILESFVAFWYSSVRSSVYTLRLFFLMDVANCFFYHRIVGGTAHEDLFVFPILTRTIYWCEKFIFLLDDVCWRKLWALILLLPMTVVGSNLLWRPILIIKIIPYQRDRQPSMKRIDTFFVASGTKACTIRNMSMNKSRKAIRGFPAFGFDWFFKSRQM